MNPLIDGLVVGDNPVDAPETSPHADSRFLDQLILRYIDGKKWEVVGAFNYHTDVSLGGQPPFTVKIPSGFLTDFASVPMIFWNIFSPTGSYGKAAVIHDFLYRGPHVVSKDTADKVFNEAMKALGTGFFTRTILYNAVRVFGGPAYKKGSTVTHF